MSIILRVAARYLADLNPPLGDPGGPCQVIKRIDRTIRNPRLKQDLIEEAEQGIDMSITDASRVYPLDVETGVGFSKSLLLTSHMQYRMDLRGITVDDIKNTLRSLTLYVKNNPKLKGVLLRGDKIRYEDPRTKLVLVVILEQDMLRLITTFWKGKPDPKPVPVSQCLL